MQAVCALLVVSPAMRRLFVIIEVILGGISSEEAVAQRRFDEVRCGLGYEVPAVFSITAVACDALLHGGPNTYIVDELAAVLDGDGAGEVEGATVSA